MPVPEVDSHGLPLTVAPRELDAPPAHQPSLVVRVPEVDETYEIERVVSATKVGGGWRLQVKWKGYDDVTSESLSHVLKETHGHPEVLRDIEKCKADYLAQHPAADLEPAPVPEPTRVQPARQRAQPARFVFSLVACPGAVQAATLQSALSVLRSRVKKRCTALRSLQRPSPLPGC